MAINNTSKIPQTFSELKKDRTFAKLLSICSKDNQYLSNEKVNQAVVHNDDTGFILPYRIQVIYLIFMVLQVNFLHWNIKDFVLPWLEIPLNFYNVILFFVYVITIIICLFNIILSWRENTIVSLINIGIVIATWHYLNNEPKIFILSTVVQIVLITTHSIVIQIKSQAGLKKWKNKGKENGNRNRELEEFYNATIKEIEQNWGLTKTSGWWGNKEFKVPLASGEEFMNNHEGFFELKKETKYDYYNPIEKNQVKGTQTDTYEKHYVQTYLIHRVSSELHETVRKSIERENYKPLYPVDIDNVFQENCKIFTIECKCKANYNYKTLYDGITSSSPTQGQIDSAQTRINQKYDDRERLHNLVESGRDYTTEQMINVKGLTAEMWEESEISKNLRQKEINDYIYKNTKYNRDSSEYSNSNTNVHSEILMYIVDDYVFYKTSPYDYEKTEKGIWADKSFEKKESRCTNYYSTRSEEVEAAIYYLIKKDDDFAHHIVERIWRDNTSLASKVIHTFSLLRGRECFCDEP